MAHLNEQIPIPMSLAAGWNCITDLSRFHEWLTIHQKWNGRIPARSELVTGLEVSSVIRLRGAPVSFDWRLVEIEHEHKAKLSGKGRGGIKAEMTLSVAAQDGHNILDVDIDLSGLAMSGPAGKLTVKVLRSDIQDSLAAFKRVFADADDAYAAGAL
ncbi:type II toxin-antitoxin system Rv0910 family toxin [Williamsia sterculiae]|uniref:Polyketide cyclase / dehydrase and lipid transport n=1 Tax=Williamsia sterculiae TaxID=1344003 RepID=A0A1N7H224_9NOCA|nr:SRPBCC family protein [Williamsia sterculiae]SIS18892.1 Polyketide cyclase / dehydrase and lipid transport [Williamsia sterculiae]